MWASTVIEQQPNKAENIKSPIQYIKGKLLGKGGFAEVYELANPATKESFACKIIDKRSLLKGRSKQKLMNEIKIQQSLNHLNTLKIFKHFEDESNFYILLELCPNESLSVLLRRRKRLIELEVQCYLLQVLSAIKYIHEHGVIHRDIKLGNILLSSKMEIKLADFGLSTKLEYEGERKRTICGTPNYIAPEILGSHNGHSFEVDIWSFGILMYTMLVGKPPFQSTDTKLTYSKIKSCYFSFPDNVSLSPQAKDLISKIIVLNPAERLKIGEIFEHDFFCKNKIPKILPFSSLTIPLSETYQKAFNKKPLTPREYLKSKEKDSLIIRSSSQYFDDKRKVNEDKDKLDLKDISESLQTRTGTRSSSCFNMKKLKIASSYEVREGGPRVWVSMWIDYSNKYGLAYRLSNGCIGLLFNDSTKLISNPQMTLFKYISLDKESKKETLIEFSLKDSPPDVYKKLQLSLYLQKYLNSDIEPKTTQVSEEYIKSWYVAQDAILFHLNNKIVQVYFRDQTEVLFTGANKLVAFVNKNKGIKVSSILSEMKGGDNEIIKRMKLSKDILLGNIESNKF